MQTTSNPSDHQAIPRHIGVVQVCRHCSGRHSSLKIDDMTNHYNNYMLAHTDDATPHHSYQVKIGWAMSTARMSTAKKVAQKAAPRKPTSVSEWKKSSGSLVELPSGNFMQIRKIGMQAMIAAGVIPNSLMSIMQSALSKGKGMDNSQMADLVKDPKQLADMVQMTNRITTMIAYEPQVHMPPANEAERDPEILYVDEIDETDKMFLFQLVSGGTSDLEKFRQQHSADMDAVSELL